MKNKIEIAIEVLAIKGQKATDSSDALRYTQAALNLAHTIATHTMTEIQGSEYMDKRYK
jgi:hypothetical protein